MGCAVWQISEIFAEDLGVGGVLSLLWFRRRLPAYATKFIEMVLMVTADHGPAVSGTYVPAASAPPLFPPSLSPSLPLSPPPSSLPPSLRPI